MLSLCSVLLLYSYDFQGISEVHFPASISTARISFQVNTLSKSQETCKSRRWDLLVICNLNRTKIPSV